MVTHAAQRRPQLRLTRRGRVVVLAFFVLLASLASAVLFTTASRADSPPATASRTDSPPAIASRAASPPAGQTLILPKR
jgi:hypothetical protein